MFDFVDFSVECPTCGHRIEEFQTKDFLSVMLKIKPWMVTNFYASCSRCNTWVEYTRNISQNELNKSLVELICTGSAATILLNKIYTKIKGTDLLDKELVKEIENFLNYDLLDSTEDKWLNSYQVKVTSKESTNGKTKEE